MHTQKANSLQQSLLADYIQKLYKIDFKIGLVSEYDLKFLQYRKVEISEKD